MSSVQNITIDINFVNGLLKNAEKLRLDRGQLLQQAGVSAELLDVSKARVTGHQFAKLSMLVVQASNDECLGYLQRSFKVGTFFIMGELALHCKNLGQAMKKCAHFIRLFDCGVDMEIKDDGLYTAFRLIPSSDQEPIDPFFYEITLMTFRQLFGWLIGKQIALRYVHFSHLQPEYVHEYQGMYSCLVECEHQYNELVMLSSYLDKPVVQTEQLLKEMLLEGPLFLLQHINNEESYVGKIRQFISNNLFLFPELEEVAEKLNITPRTLRRNLKKEGRTYQEIKNDMRRDIAIYFLTRKNMSIVETADKIGFSTPSTFIRAFKSWTGVTPYAYQKKSGNG